MNKVKDSTELISDLGDLIELDYDAIAAYQAAIERLDNAAYKTKLTEFLSDHERHVVELGNAVRKGLADERRHKGWLVTTLEKL